MNSFKNKLRKFAIPNLTLLLIAGYVVGFMIQMVKPEFMYYLALDPYRIINRKEVWRLITWVLIPPNYIEGDSMPSFMSLLFIILMLYCCYWIGTILERTWGTEKYNRFIFMGILFTVVFSFICYGYLCIVYKPDVIEALENYKAIKLTGVGTVTDAQDYLVYVMSHSPALGGASYFWYWFSTYYINISLYLVYALTFPERLIYIYFVIPIKMKWLGVVDSVYMLYLFLFCGPILRCAVAAVIINVLIFYFSNIKGKNLNPYQIHRRNSFNRAYNRGVTNSGKTRNTGGVTSSTSDVKMNPRSQTRHKCAICGKTEVSDPDMEFRYCSKCAGSYEYCSTHLFTHTHVRG